LSGYFSLECLLLLTAIPRPIAVLAIAELHICEVLDIVVAFIGYLHHGVDRVISPFARLLTRMYARLLALFACISALFLMTELPLGQYEIFLGSQVKVLGSLGSFYSFYLLQHPLRAL